jgi:hypothetical protein
MFISRRHFIAGASAATAGLIVPSFAERVLAHVANFGEPLLELSPQTNCLWHALPVDLEDSRGYLLIDTSVPYSLEAPDMTWRQYLEIRGEPVETWLEDRNLKPDQLDEPADRVHMQNWWDSTAGPSARVFNRMTGLEHQLGPQLTTPGSELGYVAFESGQYPGSWDQWVDVSCDAGLSCLQHRLNELRTGFRIEIAPDGLY